MRKVDKIILKSAHTLFERKGKFTTEELLSELYDSKHYGVKKEQVERVLAEQPNWRAQKNKHIKEEAITRWFKKLVGSFLLGFGAIILSKVGLQINEASPALAVCISIFLGGFCVLQGMAIFEEAVTK